MFQTTSLNNYSQYLAFRLGIEEYGLPIANINSIVDNDSPITRVPTAPEHVLGIINLRGDIVPIIDLAKKLGFASVDNNNKKKVIIANSADLFVGFLVDTVLDVINISGDSMEDSAPYTDSVTRDYFASVAKYDNRLIIILDIEKLLKE
ncbi:MAG TPA: purine-binding chemotaxis protein CheW [Clostridiaceae bacterium]|nr:purine-binding chemotaxis protein CheW [Clostridiaceae bacterium]